MSEISNTKEKRLRKLEEVSHLLLETGNAYSFIIANKTFIDTVIPDDFITLFDKLVKEGYPIEDLKILSNKVLNIFHLPILNFQRIEPKQNSFLGLLEQNNQEMEQVLNRIRPVFKAFVKDSNNSKLKTELLTLFIRLELFAYHYTIKENVLFPVIEKSRHDYRCLQIMWSFHDDIKRNIKTVINQLSNKVIDYKKFNRLIGDIFFNMLAIKFREERILFPYILSTISESNLEIMNQEGFKIGYPYIKPTNPPINTDALKIENGLVNLGTGVMSIEQILLVFNHLPVDITYVDENNKVLYFSTPKKRIFPRTNAIIGRAVNNCHPPESVHVVEEIIESFKSGKKDKADFWINKRGEFILIQYFAVRDDMNRYRGVIEVSQDISEIKSLNGEKRLLDW
jgi:hypothetical protein